MELFGGESEIPHREVGRPVPSGLEGYSRDEVALTLKTLDSLVERYKGRKGIEEKADGSVFVGGNYLAFFKEAAELGISTATMNSYLKNRNIRFSAADPAPEKSGAHALPKTKGHKPLRASSSAATTAKPKRNHQMPYFSTKMRAANDDTDSPVFPLFPEGK